jgi:predicted nucleic acid-binding protein
LNDERLIVSDTGPLITLEKLADGYRFIRLLYNNILVPRTVLEELSQGQFTSAGAYITHYDVGDLFDVVDARGDLGGAEEELLDAGEREAIQVALERRLSLLIEEEAGRRAAQRLGIPISGIAGQVLKAFRQGIIPAPEAVAKLRQLLQSGRINRKIYEGLIGAVREG